MRKEGSAASRSEAGAPPKRAKTGGRVKKSIDQMLEEARVRSAMASLDDDTDLPAALAAIYLGVSEDTLLELRKPPPKGADGVRGAEGPPFRKVILPGAVAQNQSVMYPLGGLREYKKKHTGTTSHEVAVKSNMLGWVTAQEPFFAEPQARRRPTVLIARAWDFEDQERDDLFARAAQGAIRVVWLSPAEAARQRWNSAAQHRTFAARWLELLAHESAAVRAAIEGTAIGEVSSEPERKSQLDEQDRKEDR